jgi:hypothetical protein
MRIAVDIAIVQNSYVVVARTWGRCGVRVRVCDYGSMALDAQGPLSLQKLRSR